VITIAVIVVYVILWKVIPVFAALFEGLGGKLPFLTQVVVNMSNFIGNFWWLIFILVGGGIFALRQYYQTDAGRYQIDKLMLKAPVIGLLLRKIAVARFCRTLGTLLSSGVAILESLEITARTAGNAVIEEALMQVRKQVEEGKTIAEPLTRSEQFPPMVCQMIGVGEQTGAMDTMLSKIADFYEDEVDAAVEGMMALIEPVIIAFLGVVIGTIVVAMYLPMFSLISQIG
jgi:type IV pilus assembly protein PilC